jgi:hypothetical protein
VYDSFSVCTQTLRIALQAEGPNAALFRPREAVVHRMLNKQEDGVYAGGWVGTVYYVGSWVCREKGRERRIQDPKPLVAQCSVDLPSWPRAWLMSPP